MSDYSAAQTARLDVWLWRARFIKTRSEAARIVQKGRVRLTRQGQTRRISKPSATIMSGDELAFMRSGSLIQIRMVAAGERRGPAPEARQLYETLGEPDDNGAADRDGFRANF